MITDFVFADNTVQQNTQHGWPHVYNVDAPGTEASGEDRHQSGGVQHFFAGNAEQGGAYQTIQTHVQERGGVTAHIEEAGSGQGGVAEDFQQAGKHLIPVGHKESSNKKEKAETCKKELQKAVPAL